MSYDSDLEREFEEELVELYKKSKEEIQYNPTRFIRMVSELGGLGAAHKLINSTKVSEGFEVLWENHRLVLSLEFCVLNPKYEVLFSDQEREICKNRLREYGFEGSF